MKVLERWGCGGSKASFKKFSSPTLNYFYLYLFNNSISKARSYNLGKRRLCALGSTSGTTVCYSVFEHFGIRFAFFSGSKEACDRAIARTNGRFNLDFRSIRYVSSVSASQNCTLGATDNNVFDTLRTNLLSSASGRCKICNFNVGVHSNLFLVRLNEPRI